MKDRNRMRKYEWNEEFYNEIIKDWNYRFPKFSYTEYPNYAQRLSTTEERLE